jgi:S-formylglutathione hydrolase FrmB
MKFVFLFLIIVSTSCFANVDTVFIASHSMQKSIKAVIITPKKYKKRKPALPVVYLLHGYDGNYSNWITKAPFLQQQATLYNFIIVCPDGGKSSWYIDSPIDTTMQYETYIAKEVVAFVDAQYNTIKTPKARAITGLSMGGHGAMSLAIKHPTIFGGCGSMSGAVNLKDSKAKYDIALRIGDTTTHAKNWTDYSVVNLVEKINPSDNLHILIDCGIDDYFFNANKLLHQKLMGLKIPHFYSENPGKHNWEYWTTSVKNHLLFFSEWFKKNN